MLEVYEYDVLGCDQILREEDEQTQQWFFSALFTDYSRKRTTEHAQRMPAALKRRAAAEASRGDSVAAEELNRALNYSTQNSSVAIQNAELGIWETVPAELFECECCYVVRIKHVMYSVGTDELLVG